MLFDPVTPPVFWQFSALLDPLAILGIGLIIVLGAILVLRLNAFLALIFAAFTVSFLAGGTFTGAPEIPRPGDGSSARLSAQSPAKKTLDVDTGEVVATPPEQFHRGLWSYKVQRVLSAFGAMAGRVGFLILMGAIIGKCMMESRSADRIIFGIFRVFGEKRVPVSLLSGGFILSIPVFYDTTFYLLVPLARSCFRRLRKNYILLLAAIGSGATLTHTLVPPTPGPLLTASELGVSVPAVMLTGTLVALLLAPVALAGCYFVNGYMPNPRIASDVLGGECPSRDADTDGVRNEKDMPSLFAAIAPIVLPVLLISCSSVLKMLPLAEHAPESALTQCTQAIHVLGDANIALFCAALLASVVMLRQRRFGVRDFGSRLEAAIIDAGLLVLITSAGGAFGAMLRIAKVGEAIQGQFATTGSHFSGPGVLLLAFCIASLIKTAQGSSTTAMLTASGIIGSLALTPDSLGFHPAYVATTIGLGSMVTGWMNDSGFWIFCRMGGINEIDAMKTWSVLLALMGTAGLGIVLVLTRVLPLVS